MNNELTVLLEMAQKIVFFGGAGVSTESNIPDFRSSSGLFSDNQNFDYPPEVILSHTFFMQNPEIFYSFYKSRMIYPHAKPNSAHLALALLEEQGKDITIVTQNIDGLHQMAGSKKVLELHGSVHKNRCTSCGEFFPLSYICSAETLPLCSRCAGLIKPEVVLYEEPLDQDTVSNAIDAISRCDLLIIGGTSLSVYPAAGLINYFHGEKLVLINKTPTPADKKADLVIRTPIGEALKL